MTTSFDALMTRIQAGERLDPQDVHALAGEPDILQLGMLADAVRRRQRGVTVTFLRVASQALDQPLQSVPDAAREVRIAGVPDHLDRAISVVAGLKAAAPHRTVSGFSWDDLERLEAPISRVLRELRGAGLDSLAALPLDRIRVPAEALDQLITAGFQQLTLTIEAAPSEGRTALFLKAGELQDRFAVIQALAPLPARPGAGATTGYDDVKSVAMARLCAPNIPIIQIDWRRYGPKLAQVALTFGADDLDNVSASDDSPDGRRRAPLEEVRRNIEAAGFVPSERDGRFALLA